MTRWSGKEITLRGLFALLGGYGIAALWCAVIARWLPMAPLDASLIATILSFLLYAGVAIWAFAARSWRRLSVGGGIAVLLGFALLKGAAL